MKLKKLKPKSKQSKGNQNGMVSKQKTHKRIFSFLVNFRKQCPSQHCFHCNGELQP